MKLVFFILTLTVMLEAKLNLLKDLSLIPRKAIIDYLFPKDPSIKRVRTPHEVKTEVNNVTTLDFIGLVERYGYPAEEHYVTTEDGYNLVIHRISGNPLSINQQKKKVVFFQHGIGCSSDCWVIFGPDKGLPFLLADQGYDVWLGNVRGNSYCRSHIKLSPRNKNFWQFSYHEMGMRDLPIMIDYVLDYTKRKTLRYISHSMGSTTLFVLLSMKPEYNAKIKLGILLAPIALWEETAPVYTFLNRKPFQQFFNWKEVYEIVSLSSTSVTIGRTLCADKTITQPVCIALIFLLSGSDPLQLNTTSLPELFSYFPAGISTQTIFHYIQNMISQKFSMYDYGYLRNYEQYGQTTPMMYDLKKVTAPLALFYGANDIVTPQLNVRTTYRHLPNAILLEENPYKSFTHVDFLWAIDVKTLIYNRVIEVLQEFDWWQIFDEFI